LIDQDDKGGRRLAEAKAFGREARGLAGEFFDAAPVKVAAVLRDFDNEINERRINTYTKTGAGEHARWIGALSAAHVPADYVWPDSSFVGYRVLILPHLKMVSPALVEKLGNYVRSGGRLVLGAQSGLKDLNCHVVEKTPPGLLAKLAGVEIEDWTTLAAGETRTARLKSGRDIAMEAFVERIRPTAADVVARWSGGDSLLGDSAAVTVNRVGKGAVYYFGGYCSAAAIEGLVQYLQGEMKISPSIAAPAEVEIVVRSAARKVYVVALNHSQRVQRVSGLAGVELLSGKKSSGEITLEPFGVAVIVIAGSAFRYC
jgi:beta-galactosidase